MLFPCLEEYELTVTDLKVMDIKDLKKCLEPEDVNNTCYWERLCWHLTENHYVNFKCEEIQLLKNPGSRALGEELIQILFTSRPEFTVAEFYEVAESLERNDICDLLCKPTEEIDANILLKDLDMNTYFNLTVLCSKTTKTVDWKEIAAELDLEDYIDSIYQDYHRKISNKSSTEEMFRAIQMYRPTFKLSVLHECLLELKLNYIAKILLDIMTNKSCQGVSKTVKRVQKRLQRRNSMDKLQRQNSSNQSFDLERRNSFGRRRRLSSSSSKK